MNIVEILEILENYVEDGVIQEYHLEEIAVDLIHYLENKEKQNV